MQLMVQENFVVWVPTGAGKPDRKQSYSKGQTLQDTDVPEGQSAADWIEKGLVRDVSSSGDHPTE